MVERLTDMNVVAGQNRQIERVMSAMRAARGSNSAYGTPTPPKPHFRVIQGDLDQLDPIPPNFPTEGGFPDAA